ncbi:mediator of RNA polymerase II transcription subunit 19a-like isoform X1 [Typha angustifolia]|uniref:mediator of RNA polymerase II transcription subunit 19a-like isoform X1 n=1 Tax=Typha angustifolia TaxID=59011 RepID=UPI003C2D92B2
MDPERKKFGRGPRELTGAVDLINHYKLLAHHKLFCKKNLPLSISDTHYLYNVVGDKEIRKGEGMELDQLFQDAPYFQEATSRIQPFELDILGQAFQLREAAPIDLPSSEKGIPTICGKSKHKSKNKERKHKKQKDKEHKKHKHRHKDNKDKKKDKIAHHNLGGDHSNKHHEKKRKYDSNADYVDTHKQKVSKQYRILYSIRVQRSVKLEDKSWKLRKDGTLAFFVLLSIPVTC